jgi:hypothetical protein
MLFIDASIAFFVLFCSDKLQHNAAQFEQHAGKLKRKYWWKNMKVNKKREGEREKFLYIDL